jgi:hypothetical protein
MLHTYMEPPHSYEPFWVSEPWVWEKIVSLSEEWATTAKREWASVSQVRSWENVRLEMERFEEIFRF